MYKYTPCSPGDPAAEERTWNDVSSDELLEPPLVVGAPVSSMFCPDIVYSSSMTSSELCKLYVHLSLRTASKRISSLQLKQVRGSGGK